MKLIIDSRVNGARVWPFGLFKSLPIFANIKFGPIPALAVSFVVCKFSRVMIIKQIGYFALKIHQIKDT